MNDIKLDQVLMSLSAGKISQNVKPVVSDSPAKTTEGVTVTNQLSSLVNLISEDSAIPDDASRVVEMKRIVQSGDYQVNTGALADALISNGVLRSVGN